MSRNEDYWTLSIGQWLLTNFELPLMPSTVYAYSTTIERCSLSLSPSPFRVDVFCIIDVDGGREALNSNWITPQRPRQGPAHAAFACAHIESTDLLLCPLNQRP